MATEDEFSFTTTTVWWWISVTGYIWISCIILYILCVHTCTVCNKIILSRNQRHSITLHMNTNDKILFHSMTILTLLSIFFYFLSMTVITILDFITPNLTAYTCSIAIKLSASLYLIAKQCSRFVFILRLYVVYNDTYFKYRPRYLLIVGVCTLLFSLALIVMTEWTMQSNIVHLTPSNDAMLNVYNERLCDIRVPDYLLICFVVFDTVTFSVLSYLFIKPLNITLNKSLQDKMTRDKIKNNPKHLNKIKHQIEESIASRKSKSRNSLLWILATRSVRESEIMQVIECENGGKDAMPRNSERESQHYSNQHLSFLTKENNLIKKYLILCHVSVISTLLCVVVMIILDLLGLIVLDMLVHCVCIVFMTTYYEQCYKRCCCGSIFIFDLIEECTGLCAKDDDDEYSLKNIDEEDEDETQSLLWAD